MTIGGPAAGAGNLISGNSAWGIYLALADGVNIQGNGSAPRRTASVPCRTWGRA